MVCSGAMAYELDSQGWEKLRALYAQMSDEELLELAAKPDDLTDMAQQVLRGEMASRNLKVQQVEQPERRWASDSFAGDAWRGAEAVSPSIMGSTPEFVPHAEEGSLERGEVMLRTFHDAFEMSRACESLEAAEVGFRVEDVSKPTNGIE